MALIDILISLVIALIMFGIGASLRFSDFKRIFSSPKALGLGLFLQMIFLPALAFTVVYLSPLNAYWAVGLFVVSLCPGGTTSNFISYLVNADTALSIAMTTINSVLILFSIPLLTNFALNYFLGRSNEISLSVTETLLQVFLMVLLPALLGVLFNEYFTKISNKLKNPLKYINIILLAGVFSIKYFAGEEQGGSGLTGTEIQAILPYALLLHIASMLLSYGISKGIRLTNAQSTTIGIEVGLQNTTLALLITGTIININEMTKPALVYALFSFFTTLCFAYLTLGRKKIS